MAPLWVCGPGQGAIVSTIGSRDPVPAKPIGPSLRTNRGGSSRRVEPHQADRNRDGDCDAALIVGPLAESPGFVSRTGAAATMRAVT